MSGAASIPLMAAALVWEGTARKWFAILAFVGLFIFAAKVILQNYKMIGIHRAVKDSHVDALNKMAMFHEQEKVKFRTHWDNEIDRLKLKVESLTKRILDIEGIDLDVPAAR